MRGRFTATEPTSWAPCVMHQLSGVSWPFNRIHSWAISARRFSISLLGDGYVARPFYDKCTCQPGMIGHASDLWCPLTVTLTIQFVTVQSYLSLLLVIIIIKTLHFKRFVSMRVAQWHLKQQQSKKTILLSSMLPMCQNLKRPRDPNNTSFGIVCYVVTLYATGDGPVDH